MTNVLPRHYYIGMIMFTLIIVAGIDLIGQLDDSRDSFVVDDEKTNYTSLFSKQSELTDEVDRLKSTIDNADEEEASDGDSGNIVIEVFGVLNGLVLAAWYALKGIFTNITFMDDVFSSVATVFGIPEYIFTILMLTVTVMIIFAIFSAIFQRDI